MPQKKFVITGYISFPGVVRTEGEAKIRVTIPAETQAEAEEKFKAFALAKAQPTVDSCREQGPFEDVEKMFRDFFQNMK